MLVELLLNVKLTLFDDTREKDDEGETKQNKNPKNLCGAIFGYRIWKKNEEYSPILNKVLQRIKKST